MTADRKRLEKAMELDPFDTVTRSILADLLEEEGDWRSEAHRETVRLTGEPTVMGWDHPFAKLIIKHDKKAFECQELAIKADQETLIVHLMPLELCADLKTGWAVSVDSGHEHYLTYTNADKTTHFGVYYAKNQENLVHINPNLFAKILIDLEYGK